MSTDERKRAREIIDSIRTNNGGITPADRAKTPAAVLKALGSLQGKLGSAIKT